MSLDFYQDQPHPCSYLEEQLARNIYPDPNRPVTKILYDQLIQHGFRRSGDHVYRPHCPNCQACVPVRINLGHFMPNRTQRRCLRNNSDITVKIRPAEFNQAHFDLYARYINQRHPAGGMENPTEESYCNFLLSSWADTAFLEFNLHGEIVAVAVTDFVKHGASAFYTFFDPNLSKRSLGTFAILKQIELACEYDLSWLYLGYWIAACDKMNYKTKFSALEAFDGIWRPIDKNTLNNQ